MEQIFFLVLVGVVALLRWFLQASESRKNSEAAKRPAPAQTSTTPIPRAPVQTEEERVRRFMEALGMPASQTPPSKTAPRPIIPGLPEKRSIQPIDPFPRPRLGRPAQPPVVVPQTPRVEKLPPVLETKPALPKALRAPGARAGSAFEIQNLDRMLAEETTPIAASPNEKMLPLAREALLARLATAQGLRDAMILREVFGPPRSLQPL